MAPSLNLFVLALAGLAAANPLPARDDLSIDARDAGGEAQCPKVIVKAPVWTFGPTSTVWTTTSTATQIVDCGVCAQATVSTLFFGHGPVVVFTTTTTATGPSITTEVKCGVPTAEAEAIAAPQEKREPVVTPAPLV